MCGGELNIELDFTLNEGNLVSTAGFRDEFLSDQINTDDPFETSFNSEHP